MKDFFVSYNNDDRDWAEWIAWTLEENGYSTILQAWDFRPGYNFPVKMRNALEDSKRTLIILSPSYVNSDYAQAEWSATFVKDPKGEKGKLLPVRIKGCDLPDFIREISYIDLVGLDEKKAKSELLNGVKSERAKPKSPPKYPGISESSFARRPAFPVSLDYSKKDFQPIEIKFSFEDDLKTSDQINFHNFLDEIITVPKIKEQFENKIFFPEEKNYVLVKLPIKYALELIKIMSTEAK